MDPSMLHLPTERLAALADDDPTPAETEHLAACAACARERRAYRALGDLAVGARGAAGAPLLSWSALSARLQDEGLQTTAAAGADPAAPAALTAIRPFGSARSAAGRAVLARRWMMRAAAAVVLFAGGLVAGRATASGVSAVPPEIADVPAAGDAPAGPAFDSEEAALAALVDAERRYQMAASYLVTNDSATRLDNIDSYHARLAVLDEVTSATRRALYEAPYDPVINRYYLTALGARDATLRQLGQTLEPAGMRVGSF
jgi:hypothetical protein